MKEKIKTFSSVAYQVIIFCGLIFFVLGILMILSGFSLCGKEEGIGCLLSRWLFVLSIFVMFHLVYKMGKDAGQKV